MSRSEELYTEGNLRSYESAVGATLVGKLLGMRQF